MKTRKSARRAALFMAAYCTLLAAFCAWYLLDTFVTEHSMLEVEPSAASDGPYTEAVTSIQLTEEYFNDTLIHIAEVILDDVHALKSAFAQDTYGRNITERVLSIAERNSALLAVNGDYYGTSRSGYVIRNGVLYRSDAKRGQQDLCIWPDGSFSFIYEDSVSAQSLADSGVWQLLSFGPALVENGQVTVTPESEVGQAKTSNPRTAIAEISPLHYLIVVADGRTSESKGLSLYELALWLRDRGVANAYNLDGGGSSTMVYEGSIVNFPTTSGRYQERAVSDIVYIGY